jgi:hypothetical protein
MNYYRVCEGYDDESFQFVDLIHETAYTEDQYDDMFHYAKNEARHRIINRFVTAEEVADIMCDTFGFRRIEIKFSRNIDTHEYLTNKHTETNDGVFEEIDKIVGSFESSISEGIGQYLKREKEKGSQNIQSIFDSSPQEKKMFKEVEKEIDRHIVKESIGYSLRHSSKPIEPTIRSFEEKFSIKKKE